MFYNKQPIHQQEKYKHMLKLTGILSVLFTDSESPYLYYRCHENIFCKYFEATNLSREDCSVDAVKDHIGIGLKTWIGGNNQKVAEFNKNKSDFDGLLGLSLALKVSKYRNIRLSITMKLHNIHKLTYHIVKRIPGKMQILEHSFDFIDIDHIRIIHNKGNHNNTYFTDGKHTYHFNSSKSTLYMIFDECILLDEFDVPIMNDPYDFLLKSMNNLVIKTKKHEDQICLRLYSVNHKEHKKVVYTKSGLNQWNASGRKRDPNEIYIPYPANDRTKNPNFFPDKDTPFDLVLPNGNVITAKVCQEDGKAIMSNPNKELGKWLLREVFEIPIGTIITYEMLEIFGIDSVIFTKINPGYYKIDFSHLGTYEEFYNEL